jgi:hypothetical protein
MIIRHSLVKIAFMFFLTACTNGAPLIESTVDTSLFDGSYTLVKDDTFASLIEEIQRTQDQERRDALEAILQSEIDRYSDFVIEYGVIRSGKSIIQEFSLTSGTLEGNILNGKAIWHEDIRDPGDMVEVNVELSIEDHLLFFTYHESDVQAADVIVLMRDSQDN